jgi:recombinational DNA repair ATPase RecF
MSASNATLSVHNFRALERLEWSPSGVCLLSGANGSGKSTALDAFQFLRGNRLHTFAIGPLIDSRRKRAEGQALTIVLTTRSPVVMNDFPCDVIHGESHA